MIKAGIFGATGYTGLELVKLLRRHPAADIAFVASQSQAGKTLRDVFPAAPALPLIAGADAPLDAIDVAFLCLPHAAAAETATVALAAGTRVIDLSADFRLRDAATYAPVSYTHLDVYKRQAQAAALLDALTPRGRFDVVADYAFPLTLSVIAALIGIPQSDLARVKAWSLIIADVLDYKRTWDVMAAGNRMTAEFTAYLADIVAARRARPENDLISRLLAAVAGEARLAEDELIALCVMLLFAGHETTVNLISAGALLLLTQPEQLALFRARPELTDTAVDEILRLHSPIQATTRIAYADVTLGDRLIRRGESVTLLLGAANRDPAAFPDPNRLDIARRPNRHLAFGRGIHFCLGAPLAMAQGGLALRLLFERSTDWRLACNPIWSETFGFRGLTSLSIGKFSSRCA